MNKKRKIIFLILGAIFLLVLIYIFKIAKHYPKNIVLENVNNFFGVTYSKKYAKELGLDWKETYIAILDELNVKKIRIPVYWDEIEKVPGEFDFSDYNYLIEEGEKRQVEFILNFGMRVARWPECHFPLWLDPSNKEYLQERTNIMIQETINNFKPYDSIVYWQLENEPLLDSFGVCPKSDYGFLQKELALTKGLDNRPIIISATGELSFWNKEIKIADIFGTTMYRVVYNKFLGYIKYPYSSKFYSRKARLNNIGPSDAFIIELQAEPWVNEKEIVSSSSKKYLKSFNIDQFRANTQFALDTGFDRAYLWGVEWWYLRYKKMNDPVYWEFAKTLF
ncbi:MAG TPA: hypothetical protein PK142_00665 [bacterium]|nr:hypothetical protein [bacterium]